MQKIRLIVLLLVFALFSVVISCNQKQEKVENNSEENVENEESGFPQDEVTKVLNLSNGKKIYVRAKIWGISSNHEEIVFSETPINIPNKESDYIFYTDEVLYKIDENNVLTIYAPNSGKSIPEKSFENITIVFKGLKTSSQIRDYSTNYQKYGLEKVSVN